MFLGGRLWMGGSALVGFIATVEFWTASFHPQVLQVTAGAALAMFVGLRSSSPHMYLFSKSRFPMAQYAQCVTLIKGSHARNGGEITIYRADLRCTPAATLERGDLGKPSAWSCRHKCASRFVSLQMSKARRGRCPHFSFIVRHPIPPMRLSSVDWGWWLIPTS